MRKNHDVEFQARFRIFYMQYQNGKWSEAKKAYENISLLLVDKRIDGPTQTLSAYMASFDWNAPSTWKGVRELTEK